MKKAEREQRVAAHWAALDRKARLDLFWRAHTAAYSAATWSDLCRLEPDVAEKLRKLIIADRAFKQ